MNPSAGDVSLFLPLEQTAIAQTVATRDLTGVFAIYNVAGALGGAFGALVSGLPVLLAPHFGWNPLAAQRFGFVAYAILGVLIVSIYRSLSHAIEARTHSPKSRRWRNRARSLCAWPRCSASTLSAAASRSSRCSRYGCSAASTCRCRRPARSSSSRACSARLSQFVSSRLAARFGRINTMVYTHLPANAFLILAALMPTAPLAIVFLLLRSAMSSMDVPARQSYVMAVVPPEERAAAASVTNVPRSLRERGRADSRGHDAGCEFIRMAADLRRRVKIAYDVLLLLQFRALRPEDELSG